MIIGQIIANQYDMSSGSSETILTTSKNLQQLEKVIENLNKKFGRGGDDFTLEFTINIIDTQEIPTSLTRKEIGSLWN